MTAPKKYTHEEMRENLQFCDAPTMRKNMLEQLLAEVEHQRNFCQEFIWGEDHPHEYTTLHEQKEAHRRCSRMLAKLLDMSDPKPEHGGTGCISDKYRSALCDVENSIKAARELDPAISKTETVEPATAEAGEHD